jgi:hypothetical protein
LRFGGLQICKRCLLGFSENESVLRVRNTGCNFFL